MKLLFMVAAVAFLLGPVQSSIKSKIEPEPLISQQSVKEAERIPSRLLSARQKRSAESGGSRSPLLEIVLRILDSIQIMPKKRSRRHESSTSLPLPLLRRTIFGGRRATERPLLALSLESSETAPARAPEDSESEPLSAAGELEDYGDEENSYEWDHHPLTYHQLWASTSQSFYDVLVNVLQLVGNQVRQEVQRSRVQQAAALHTLPTTSDEYYDDDDYGDYDDDEANDDDLMV